MRASGVLSSWLTFAKSCVFTRSSSFAFSYAAPSSWSVASSRPCRRARSSSARLRSATSRIAVMASMPSSVSSGERLISAGNSVPSFRSP